MTTGRFASVADSKKLHLLISFHRKSLLTRDRDKLAELIGLEVREILEAERSTIFLLDKQRDDLYGKFAIGLDERDLAAMRFPVSQGIAGYVARSGLPINVPDAYKSPYFNPEFDKKTKFKTNSVLAVPLKETAGQTIGVLAAFNKTRGRHFTDEDEGLLQLLASQLAATLEIFGLLDNLKLAGLESMVALAQTAEFRDQEDTAPHIKRVGIYSSILAEALGFPAAEVEVIRLTSPLHDIGKVAIPDTILRKKGIFTPEESAEMKKHARYGYEMLKDFKSPLLQVASRIALCHHEKYDGTGYPQNLKGDAIPLEARIVSLTDSFDAATSHRIYKEAKPFEQVCQELVERSTKQFDPMVVDAFIKNRDRFNAAMIDGHKNDGNSGAR